MEEYQGGDKKKKFHLNDFFISSFRPLYSNILVNMSSVFVTVA